MSWRQIPTKHWKDWMLEPPQSNVPVAIRRTNQSHEDVVIPEQLGPYFNIANLWWRPWPEDGDL